MASADCTKKAEYSATWAAKLPKDLPVYPRGAVQEAAGTDADGCHLLVVNYVSPVTPKDVIDFYFTKATGAGYGAEYRMDGSDHVIGGRKGGQAYVVQNGSRNDSNITQSGAGALANVTQNSSDNSATVIQSVPTRLAPLLPPL